MSHTTNRVQMATRLADFLETNSATDITVLEQLDDNGWRLIADAAGERIPSPGTRACVLIALRERQRPLDARLLEGLPR